MWLCLFDWGIFTPTFVYSRHKSIFGGHADRGTFSIRGILVILLILVFDFEVHRLSFVYFILVWVELSLGLNLFCGGLLVKAKPL